MHRQWIWGLLFLTAAPTWGQSGTNLLSSEERSASFRPTPLRGASALPGRRLSLRETMAQRQMFVLSPAGLTPAPTASISQRAAAARARLRASQQASARLASQIARQSGVGQPQHQASHALTPGFTVPPPTAEYQREQIVSQSRWLNHARMQMSAPDLNVAQEGNTVVLTGQVANEHDARVLEQLLLLEPGVHEVDNRLTLKTAAEAE